MGPHFLQFLRESYEQAKVTGCWNMAAQPDIESTWNTRVSSTYGDMRLSAAVAVTAADVQNRLIRRDGTLNLRVMGRQPHPNPSYAAYMRSAAQPAWRRQDTPHVWGRGPLENDLKLEGLLLLLAVSGGGRQKR